MNIARVFPRRTNATPDDPLAFVGMPDLLAPEWLDEVHISVAFTYDMPLIDKLAEAWGMRTGRLSIGGPGTGMRGEQFTPGVYLKKGYVITSRGCPHSCWYCSVHDREGDVRELPITEGWNVLDDNLLACSEKHITNVFKMLMEAKKVFHQPIQFTGGFEAGRFHAWMVEWLLRIKPKQIFFAYDYESYKNLEILEEVNRKLISAGISKNSLRCYVLIGCKYDTFEEAEKRLLEVVEAGYIPMAMLYRDENGNYKKDWTKFQKEWARPAIMRTKGVLA